MGSVEVVVVDSKKVTCDGTNYTPVDALSHSSGHPLVYLNMGTKDSVTCPYCSKYFTIKKSANIFLHQEQKI